jgi:hypothetical protein
LMTTSCAFSSLPNEANSATASTNREKAVSSFLMSRIDTPLSWDRAALPDS